MATAATLKITKITISPQWFDRSLQNLVRLQNESLNCSGRKKNSNFTNPRWQTAAILKTVKSPYLCSRLTDFDEIWHDTHIGPLHWLAAWRSG